MEMTQQDLDLQRALRIVCAEQIGEEDNGNFQTRCKANVIIQAGINNGLTQANAVEMQEVDGF